MASIKPRKRGESDLKGLDAEMQRAFSMKMGQIKRLKRDVHEEDPDSGVVFISHIPHGFYEPQMKKFFSQFGNIKRLRLSRSKKSGQSKGYAYIEFEFSEVAKVVAETMHNYLMYQKLLKCFYVPKEKLHPDTFKGCFRRFKRPRRREIAAQRNNSLLESGKEHILESQKRRVAGLKKKQKKLEALGIDFKIESVESEWTRLKEANLPAPKVKPGKSTPVPKATVQRSPRARTSSRKSGRTGQGKRKTAQSTPSESPTKAKQRKTSDVRSEIVTESKKELRKMKEESVTPVGKKIKGEVKTSVEKPNARVKKGGKSTKATSKTKSVKGRVTSAKKSKRLSL